jgi:DNA-binding IscR family transcriptional regulator
MKENDLLGSSDLHERLCVASCILAELLSLFPASVEMEQLALAVGHPREKVEEVCVRLRHQGLLQADAGRDGIWRLAGDPAKLTLADLFAALLAPSTERLPN